MRPRAASTIIRPVGGGFASPGPTGVDGFTITAGRPSGSPRRRPARSAGRGWGWGGGVGGGGGAGTGGAGAGSGGGTAEATKPVAPVTSVVTVGRRRAGRR